MTAEEYLLKRITELEEEKKEIIRSYELRPVEYSNPFESEQNEIIDKLKKENSELKETIRLLKHKEFQKFIHDTPIFVWHTKKRNNTTIKFANGETSTVHKLRGEVDDLETAIVYALVKHKYGKKIVENLIKHVKEVK